ncbi:MAG TPA: diguanylate cyclase [Stellaceae bacterium]|nr:diguanylate cyclase [Stellaceae bacterium]
MSVLSDGREAGSNAALKTQILIVEDERIVALHLRQRLAKFGYEVTATVASGAQALREIHRKNPDVILMDIHIDGAIDGIETTRSIPPELRIPVIYLTAYSEEATLERARGTRPYGYLVKPFSDRELHATIQMVLERRKVDLELHKSEERLGLALASAEMESWEFDAATHAFVHMDNADHIVGSGPGIFPSTWDTLLAQIHDEDRPLIEAMFAHLSLNGGTDAVEFRRPNQDGARWIKVCGKQFPGDADGAKRIIGVMQDVTENREKDERLHKAAAELVSQKEQLSVALVAASKSSVAKSDFLAVMSHELRTPMNAILGFGQLLDLKTFGQLNTRQHEYVGHILQAGEHLLHLIGDLLDLSKIEAAKLQVTIDSVETAPLLKRVAASFASLTAEHKIVLTTQTRGDLVVDADTTRLYQVLTNLVSNAIKYNRPGGSVRMTDEASTEGWVRITVSDTGIGIPARRNCEVFEPFNRLGAECSTVEGTGIGLPISKRLIELMGGRIGFESTPGVGSKFWIDIPAHRPTETMLVQRDDLTGLPSLSLLTERISRAISEAPHHKKRVVILFLGLDGLKQINESLGRSIGDKLLQSTASRLVECVRGSDTVSRRGDEEFIVLLSEVKLSDDVSLTANRMLQAVSAAHSIDRYTLYLDASIGVSLYPDDGLDAETLIQNAYAAMCQAKEMARRS